MSHRSPAVTLGIVAGISLLAGCPDGSPTETVTPPGAPTIGTATPGNGSASIAFTAPASDGGAQVTAYVATCTAGGASSQGTAAASPVTVNGLTNGTAYACSVLARNSAGDGPASASVTVTPFTVPNAPTLTAATRGNGSASLSFTAPSSNGGSAITGYTGSCSPTGGAAITAAGTGTPITVSGLTNGTAYGCTVRATNAAGDGAASNTINVTPATVPGAPTIGSGTPGNGSATVSFTAPSSNGGLPITSYTVTCAPAAGPAPTASASASPIAVSGLANGTSYSCTVVARNEVGPSAASGAVSVTPTAGGGGSASVPGAPTIGTATAGNGQATITFTAPASNGGSPITSYTATCTANGQTTRTGTAAASPITVTSLTNGVNYACSVTATNAVGTSAPSSSVSVTPTAGTGGSLTGHLYCSYSHNKSNGVTATNAIVAFTCTSTERRMTMNQIPDHAPGTFPNSGNPHAIAAQTSPSAVTTTLNPAQTGSTTQKSNVNGWALNGVKFDPATAETCPEKSYCPSGFTASFNVEALNQTLFSAGVDNSNAHVQPGGAYHYHGMPNGYMEYLRTQAGASTTQRITLIGFMVDGFPIYAKWGYSDPNDTTSGIREIRSSWRLKTTPDAGRVSAGTVAMGTFTQDWEYVPGHGDLDECNGRTAKTPEFPNGIYQYYVTEGFPYIQRCLKGTVPAGGPPPIIMPVIGPSGTRP